MIYKVAAMYFCSFAASAIGISMTKKPITMRDIASRVGVHTSTVSRVLNSDTHGMVSREVALKVRKAAEDLGYRLNPFARSLKTNRSHTIGVIVPDLTDPLFPPILRGIEDTLITAGYTTLIANSYNDPARDLRSYRTMQDRKVDGLVLATARRSDPVVEDCVAAGTPVVLVNRMVDNHGAPSVINDDIAGMRLAVEEVARLGHRRIAHVAGPQDLSTGHDRLVGFLAATRSLGLEPDDDAIIIADSFTIQAGHDATLALLDRAPAITAIVTASDMLALGCYTALESRGLYCPTDISVVGFNDMTFSDKFCPPLTSVRTRHTELGSEAAKLLLRMIEGEQVGGISIVLKPSLVTRGSTAVPGSGARAQGCRPA